MTNVSAGRAVALRQSRLAKRLHLGSKSAVLRSRRLLNVALRVALVNPRRDQRQTATMDSPRGGLREYSARKVPHRERPPLSHPNVSHSWRARPNDIRSNAFAAMGEPAAQIHRDHQRWLPSTRTSVASASSNRGSFIATLPKEVTRGSGSWADCLGGASA
jgi:hypothetical protein